MVPQRTHQGSTRGKPAAQAEDLPDLQQVSSETPSKEDGQASQHLDQQDLLSQSPLPAHHDTRHYEIRTLQGRKTDERELENACSFCLP